MSAARQALAVLVARGPVFPGLLVEGAVEGDAERWRCVSPDFGGGRWWVRVPGIDLACDRPEARERLPRTEEKAAKATARFQRERAVFIAEIEALAQVAGLIRRDVAGVGFVDVRAMCVALDELAAARAAR